MLLPPTEDDVLDRDREGEVVITLNHSGTKLC